VALLEGRMEVKRMDDLHCTAHSQRKSQR
jgi:hypothetical protein